MTESESLDLLMRCWANWKHRSGSHFIRYLTGVGQGSIDEAGARPKKPLHAPETGEVWDDEPLAMVDDEMMETINTVIMSLPQDQLTIVMREYCMRGKQREKARDLNITETNYSTRLLRARNNIMIRLNEVVGDE